MGTLRCLITGGAGFIGSHLADGLLAAGHAVRALDVLDDQVHGPEKARPPYLSDGVELQVGDVRDPAAVRTALRGIDAVFHLAAAVGVGQSMYEIERYTSVNNLGTAVLLEALIAHPVQRLVVASSMSLYGEGLYRDAAGRDRVVAIRPAQQLLQGRWDWTDQDGRALTPVATPEDKVPGLASVYALSKYDQERLCLITGRSYGIPTVALRFFNAYGCRQSLSNPYTGVLAIFASRLLNGRRPLIYEDGRQLRDFVSVHDVVQGCLLALQTTATEEVFNIGSGEPRSILDIARKVATVLGKPELEPEVTGKYRVGDIRHCFADLARSRTLLGYHPSVALDDGIVELASWLTHQRADDRAERAAAELAARGLTT
jgi:dTDP-L-rhamnose 4-epimerase